MITPEIQKMSTQDRMILIEEIWDTLRHDDVESPSWHESVIDKRRTQIENGQAELISLDELRANKK